MSEDVHEMYVITQTPSTCCLHLQSTEEGDKVGISSLSCSASVLTLQFDGAGGWGSVFSVRLTDLLVTFCFCFCTVNAGNRHAFGGRLHEAEVARKWVRDINVVWNACTSSERVKAFNSRAFSLPHYTRRGASALGPDTGGQPAEVGAGG
jgi:hypothetical protein